MSDLTMVHDADGVMAWNGERDIQMIATRMADGEWHIEATIDGECELDTMAADGSLITWVDALYGDLIELLDEDA